MDDKLKWMAHAAACDEMNLSYFDMAYILAADDEKLADSPFEPAEIDYVLELSKEWDQE